MHTWFLLTTGYNLLFSIWGGFAGAPVYVHIMNGLGIAMMLIFMHVFFAPYKRLKRAVAAEDWPTGGKYLAQIRVMVGINTLIGFITILARYVF